MTLSIAIQPSNTLPQSKNNCLPFINSIFRLMNLENIGLSYVKLKLIRNHDDQIFAL